MPYLALLLLFFALLLFWLSWRSRKATGLPGGRVIYSDTRSWGPLEKPLYDPNSGLTGRPDYLVDQGGKLIPVEVKTTSVSDAPYDSHIFQLAAYCMLVHHVLGKRPPYGILHYANRTYAIDYTPQLEKALYELLEEMRQQSARQELNRSHESPRRCSRCGFRSICDQHL
ncbi:MAG: CRISPR-associated protein Cas4 [Omnitrophica WOR_2 bacterium]